MTRVPLTILLLTSVAHPALAQETAAPASETASAQPEDEFADDSVEGEEIVVQGQKPRGSVVGDIPAENVLNPRDIRATGATSIS